jgi:hypothetical protein
LWDYITKGAGVMEFIKGEINNLVSKAFDNIKTYVFETVIKAGIEFILELLTPVSAFIKACKAIYKIILFFVEHGKQIIDLLNAIIDSIVDIAGGNISKAAAAVENTLVKTIPVIIGFLAGLLDIDGIADAAKKIIDDIRAPINKAIDWVINKAASLGRGIVGGAKKVAGKVAGLFFPKKKFTADSEEHTVEATESGDDYAIVIRSEARGIDEFIMFAQKKARENSIKDVGTQIAILGTKHNQWNALKVAKSGKGPATPKENAKKETLYTEISELVETIWKKVGTDGPVPDSVILWGPLDSRGRATAVTADPLTKKGEDGSAPTEDPPGYADQAAGKRSPLGSRRAHLLHRELHGPGKVFNLTPTSESMNKLMYFRVERYALEALGIRKNAAGGKVPKTNQIKYTTTVTYDDKLAVPMRDFAKSITMTAVDKKTNAKIGEGLTKELNQ